MNKKKVGGNKGLQYLVVMGPGGFVGLYRGGGALADQMGIAHGVLRQKLSGKSYPVDLGKGYRCWRCKEWGGKLPGLSRESLLPDVGSGMEVRQVKAEVGLQSFSIEDDLL